MAIEKQVNVIISAQDKFSGAMTDLGSSWAGIAKVAAAAEVAILAASIAAAKFSYDIGKDVVSSAVDFGDAIYDITAVAQSFGTTGEDISKILDDLVNRFPVTGREAGIALETIAQRGFGAREEMAALGESALNLSIATGRDLEQAVGALTSTMNQFGLGADDTTRLMNLFSAAQFSSATSVDQLEVAMRYAGASMANAGQSVETTTALLALLANKGLEASQTGTTLRMAMTQLYTETDKGAAVLAKYGLTYDDVNPAQQDFADIIEKLGAGNGPVFSAKDAVDLFGTRAQIMASIIRDGADKFREYRDSITGTTAGVDALEEKLKKFDVVVNNLGGSMDIFKKSIGEDLAKAIAEFIGYDEKSGLRGVITFLYEMEQQYGFIGDEFLKAFENVRDILGSAFSEVFPDMESFYTWLVNMAGALRTNIEILATFLAGGVETFGKSATNVQLMVEMLELVRIALVGLTAPLAVLHDAFYGVYYVAKEGFEGIGGLAAWLDQKIAEFALSALVQISKIPIFGNTDIIRDAIAEVGQHIVSLKEAQEKGFTLEPTNFWYDNVMKASAQSKAAIEDFARGAKTDIEGINTATHSNVDAFTTFIARVEQGGEAVQDYGHKNVNAFTAMLDELEKVNDAAKNVAPEIETWAQKLKDAGFEIEKVSGNMVTVKGNSDAVSLAIGGIQANMEDAQISTKKVGDTMVIVGGETDKAAGYVEKTVDGVTLLTNETDKTAQSFITVRDGVVSVSSSLEEANKKGLELKVEDAKTALDIFKTEVSALSDIIKTKIEWEAKIEIAQLEEDTKRAVGYAETIRDSFVAAAEATSTAFAGLTEVSGVHFYEYLALVEKQLDIQADLAAAQIALTQEQTEYMRLRNEALRKGDAASQVNVSVEGDMEGWLAGLIESLFKDIFVKASSEGFQVLAEG